MDDVLLTIEGENISFKKRISEYKAGQIIAQLNVGGSVGTLAVAAPGVHEMRTASPATARGLRSEIKDLPISSTLEGYPSYHDLPTKADKILWILQYAETYQVLDLNSVEIDFLSRQLREPIETKNFGAFNQRNRKSGYVMMSKNSFRITKPGQTRLTSLVK